MKKSTLLLALGGKPPEGDDDAEMDDTGAVAPDDDGDGGEDQAEKDSFETLMDSSEDIETRMEALRAFIQSCNKAGY